MRFARIFTIGLLCLLWLAAYSAAAETPSDSLVMTCATASVWNQDGSSIIEMHGPVKVEFDHREYTADNAVVWMTPEKIGPDHTAGQRLTMTLIGHARIKQQWGEVLYPDVTVTFPVAGAIKLVGQRTAEPDAGSELFKSAVVIRDAARSGATTGPTTAATTEPTTQAIATTIPTSKTIAPGSLHVDHSLPALPVVPGLPSPAARSVAAVPTTEPITSTPPPTKTVEFDLNDFTRERTDDGNLAFVFTNGVTLRYMDEKKNLLEFVAHDMVLFTNLKDMKSISGGDDKNFIADHVTSAYFDGDVQIYVTPTGSSAKGEVRMRAERVYYEFATDRAVMTDVLFHTVDLRKQIAVFMRAEKMRQLSQGEYKVENVSMSSSAFNPPTFGMTAAHAYVFEEDSGDPRIGARVEYNADNVLLNAFGIPFLYFPGMSGTMTARGSAFRDIGFENDNEFGFGLRTKWGLFESLDLAPPEGLEATYSADYFSKRGPGGGIDAIYNGGVVSDTDKQPWNFLGDLHAFFVDDRGVDVLGASRANSTPPDTFRGRLYFEHQHFFPDDFTLQLRLGYLSDSTFMPQWFDNEYENGLPVDESIYLKHQVDSEVVAIAAEFQPNRAISTADEEQQNREVSELPQIDYHRVGESVFDDHMTLFSDSSAGAYKFDRNTESLRQQGFFPGVEPGLPSYAYTGDPGRTVERADTRQELDLPIDLGPVKVVPYVMGRYTGYSSGVVPPSRTSLLVTNPDLVTQPIPEQVVLASPPNRLIGAVGARMTTSFWHVDDSVESDIFDLHRLRHVIEPEVNVFASASTVDQNRVFIYDPQVDAINDIQAVQFALRQRWQTKRGGPGRWRSVDVFTLNTSVNLFGNQPAPQFRNPTDFRGAFFYSEPEFSLARNSANADATWRISDSTALLGDVQENLDYRKLATASIGIAIQRDQRLSYYVGTRYVSDLDSNVATVEVNYELDKKYSVAATESFDFASSKDVYYTFALIRKFDNFSASVRVYYDQTTAQKGFSFSLSPNGLGRGLGTTDLQQQQE